MSTSFAAAVFPIPPPSPPPPPQNGRKIAKVRVVGMVVGMIEKLGRGGFTTVYTNGSSKKILWVGEVGEIRVPGPGWPDVYHAKE